MIPSRFINISRRCLVILVILLFVSIVWRVFVSDRFIIPSDSMSPALQKGDRIIVNKILYGARIYKDYDFHDGMDMKCFRIKGLRRIRRNDVLVFNFPINNNRISFKINYVYAKRCVGLPGDTLRIVDGFYKVNGCSEPLGNISSQKALSVTPIELLDEYVVRVMQPSDTSLSWTIKDFGPVYIPAEGDTLLLDDYTRRFYATILDYEGTSPYDSIHVFTHDYFFMAGDNVLDSRDSRYWGLLPDDYIVGIVKGILFARNPVSGQLSFYRSRFL